MKSILTISFLLQVVWQAQSNGKTFPQLTMVLLMRLSLSALTGLESIVGLRH